MRNTFRVFALVLMVCLSMAGLSISTPALADYENTWVNTGDQRKDIVGVALTQVGNTNASHRYRSDNLAWCASFVCYAARAAGIDSSIIKTTGLADADDLGITYKGRPADRSSGINYTPQPGDIIIFDWESNGFCYKSPASAYGDHVGIVTNVANNMVYTVEGNSNGKVQQRSYSLNDVNIKGFGIPNYKTGSSTTASSNNSTGNNGPVFIAGVYCDAFSPDDIRQKVGRVYAGDRCYIKSYSDDYLTILCEWPSATGGYKLVSVKKGDFRIKCTKYSEAYSNQELRTRVGRCYIGDCIRVIDFASDYDSQGNVYRVKMFLSCPWENSGSKNVWVDITNGL